MLIQKTSCFVCLCLAQSTDGCFLFLQNFKVKPKETLNDFYQSCICVQIFETAWPNLSIIHIATQKEKKSNKTHIVKCVSIFTLTLFKYTYSDLSPRLCLSCLITIDKASGVALGPQLRIEINAYSIRNSSRRAKSRPCWEPKSGRT